MFNVTGEGNHWEFLRRNNIKFIFHMKFRLSPKRWCDFVLCRWVQFWFCWVWCIPGPLDDSVSYTFVCSRGKHGGVGTFIELHWISNAWDGLQSTSTWAGTILHCCRIFNDWTFQDVCFPQLSSPPHQCCHFHWLCYDDLCMPVWRHHGIWLSCGNWNRILKFLHRHLELASSFRFALQNARESYAQLPSVLFT